MIFIRHNVTYLYLTRFLTWTPDTLAAHSFSDSGYAERYCAEKHLNEVHLVFRFSDGAMFFMRLEEEPVPA